MMPLRPVGPAFDVADIHRTDMPSWYVSYRGWTEIVEDQPVDASHFIYDADTQTVTLFVDAESFEPTGFDAADLHPVDQLDRAFACGVVHMRVCLWYPNQTVRFYNYHGSRHSDVRLHRHPPSPVKTEKPP